jgi:hypothetical protein
MRILRKAIKNVAIMMLMVILIMPAFMPTLNAGAEQPIPLVAVVMMQTTTLIRTRQAIISPMSAAANLILLTFCHPPSTNPARPADYHSFQQQT